MQTIGNDVEEYSAILERLKKKFDEINASPKWTDDVVKNSFNSTAMDYMESFNNLLKRSREFFESLVSIIIYAISLMIQLLKTI